MHSVAPVAKQPAVDTVVVVVVMELRSCSMLIVVVCRVEPKTDVVEVNCAPTMARGVPVPAQAAFALTPLMILLKSEIEPLEASATGFVPAGPVTCDSAAA